MNRTKFGVVAAMALTLSAVPLAAQDMHKHGGHHPRFDDPKKWSAAFDNPERDKWQMPDRVIEALALRPTDSVADIGAGTGYMAVRFARQLKSGTAFAVDIEPNMVQHMAERAKAAGIDNLRAVKGSVTSPNLPEAVDVIFLLNTYHHLDARPGLLQTAAHIAEIRRPRGDRRLQTRVPRGGAEAYAAVGRPDR